LEGGVKGWKATGRKYAGVNWQTGRPFESEGFELGGVGGFAVAGH